MTLGESVKSLPAPPEELQASPPPVPPRPKGLVGAKLLLAPLLGLSLVAHLLVLFAPLPPRPIPEVEEEAAEEEFVDLLSIGSLAVPEPEPEPDLPTPLPTETVPPPQALATPSQPIITEVFPDTPPPAAAPPPSEPAEAPPEQPAAPIEEEEVAEIFTTLTRGAGDSDFDSTATSFPAIAYLTRGGIGTWSPAEQSCFFEQISDADYQLRSNAVSLRYLTRNEQYIRNEDVPRTFQAAQYQVSDVPGGFCNRAMFQVLRDGQPFLFVSVVGIGVGAPGQQAGGLVIIWASDPRSG